MLAPGRGSIEGDTRFLDPAVAAAVGNLELVARFIVEGFLIGLHRSPYHGFSAEFSSYREYSPGDDLRHLDWKVFGRTDRFYLKQFEENTNLACWLLLDCSGSMKVGGVGKAESERVSKFTYARQLAAGLAYLMLKQQDAVGMLAFADGPVASVNAHTRTVQLGNVLTQLSRLAPEKGTDVARGLAALPDKLARRGLVVRHRRRPGESLAVDHAARPAGAPVVGGGLTPTERRNGPRAGPARMWFGRSTPSPGGGRRSRPPSPSSPPRGGP